MHDALPFLVRLGLHTDADTHAIRRAYARELKLIDQASQALQFQHLREAYEAALHWAGRGGGMIISQGAAVGEVEEPEARALASQVFAQFLEACIPLRQKAWLRDQSIWEQALRHHVADARLLDLSALAIFEQNIAVYLAAGWRCGNETLFLVATTVFEWEGDSWRVQQLGAAGSVIARTLEQRYLFDCQDDAPFKASQNVLAGLRLSAPPMRMRLATEMPYLESMLLYFPDLIAVTAGMDNVERWRQYAPLTPPAGTASVQPITFTDHKSVSQGRNMVRELSVPLTVILVVIALVRFYYFVNQF
ncbi:MAG: hypothetical protein WKG03_11770 [Telluria sp.]